jgi:hypothetical protein
MFSSVASLFGNVGQQANYSAANAYMDELARWRVAQGMPGLSVQWPAVSGVGMAEAMDERAKVGKSLSVGVTTVKQVLRQLTFASNLAVPVQTVLPRGLLVEGVMPPCVAPLTTSVKVKMDRPSSSSSSSSRSGGGGGGGGRVVVVVVVRGGAGPWARPTATVILSSSSNTNSSKAAGVSSSPPG